MLKTGLCIVLFALAAGCAPTQKPLTDYVNPLLGTATLWDSVDLGFKPTKRTWGAEVFPGSSLPNAMVQVSPVTKFHSGAGYQYEDSVIYGFTHTNKGHWNLCHIPLLPVTGTPLPGDYCSPYSHARESAAPGYYRVFLDRYGVDAELTSTLRCAFHKYTYPAGAQAALLADLQRSNEHVRAWDIRKEGDNAFAGWQQTGEKMYFYAVADRPVTGIEPVAEGDREIRIVRFGDGDGPVELRIGFSFVSEENARKNLEAEMLGRSFADVRSEATAVWNDLLGRIRVEGGTEREKGLFYSCLYRSFLWPALRSDVNGEFTDADPMSRPTSSARTPTGAKNEVDSCRPSSTATTLRRSWPECTCGASAVSTCGAPTSWSCATPPCRGRAGRGSTSMSPAAISPKWMSRIP